MHVGLVTGKHQIEFPEMPEPMPSPGKAVVQIAYCGICGTDLHAYESGGPYSPSICGHEWCGTVSAAGEGVSHVREGDRVGVGVPSACGNCNECRAGDGAHCIMVMMGMTGSGPFETPHGGFAPAIAVDAGRLYPLRDGISDIQGAALEPATVAVHAVRRTPLRLGDTVIVIGAGPIGLFTLQCARAAGAGHCVIIEPDSLRGQKALEVGANAVINPDREDLAARIQKECGALGPDIVFECAGIPATINQAVEIVRRGGVVSLVGLANLPAQIVPAMWLMKEVRVVASLAYLREEFDIAMQLVLDKRLQMEPLVTSTVGLQQLAGAFDALLGLQDEVKILVDPRR